MISRKTFLKILKYFLFTLMFFIFCSFQTSFWAVLIHFLPAPQLWLIFLVFIFLKWPGYSTVFYSYFLGYILTLFTLMPLKISLFGILGIYGFVWIFKTRIQSTSLFLFSVLSGAASLFYSSLYLILSSSLELKMTSVLFFDRLLQAGITFLLSSVVYFILDGLHKYFDTTDDWSKEQPHRFEAELGDS
jgi:hypothetical protein